MRVLFSLSMLTTAVAAAFCAAAAENQDSKKATPAPAAKAEIAKPGTKAPGSNAPGAKARAENESNVKIAEDGQTSADLSDSEALGEPASKYPADEQELLKTAEAYVKGYAERDTKAVAALFSEDAEYVDVDGQVFQGREAIEKTLGEFFDKNPDCKLLLDIASIRFLSPNLAIEDGTTVCMTHQDGPPAESRYTAIHMKTEGQWQVASVREHGASNARQHALRLQQLDWLVGNWMDEGDDSVVHFNCRPSADGNFLIRDFEVSVAGEKVIEGTQRIGWDPVSGKFRAWTFDSQGGYFDGYLIRDGERWILSSSGVTADGHAASGKAIFTPVNGHTITWQAVDRDVNGARIEDSEEFTLVKKGPQPQEHAEAGK